MRSSVAAVIAVFVGVRPGICMIAEPSLILSVFAARYARTVTASVPHASAVQTESKPSRSACCTSGTRSAGFVPGGA